MDNGRGAERATGNAEPARRAWAKDSVGAIALAEGSFSERVFVAIDGALTLPARNVFGGPVVAEPGANVQALTPRFIEAIEAGERAALIGGAREIAGSRDALARIRARRLSAVVHVAREPGTAADALALADLGWGVLVAAGVEESLDFALIARRAAEDCGTPFFVVHERGAARHVEAVLAPSPELVEVFVGAPRARIRLPSDPAHPVHAHVSERAFAERVTFALGSAMRELESLTGRRRDVIERIPAGDASLMLVAAGELGESLIAAVESLRAQGQDVGALKVNALRPFPGPRMVKAMARALALTVLESVDDPLAQSSPLAREIKAAFADAMTWAPGYPGIGRMPRISTGIALSAGHELEAEDLDAAVHNMLADERGKRSFVFGGEESVRLEATAPPAKKSATPVSMRGRVRDAATAEACAEVATAVVSSALGLYVRASVRKARAGEGEGFAFDLIASRERPRGAHAPHAVRVVVVEDPGMLTSANPLARLAEDGVLAVPSRQQSADAVWAEVPAYAKAIVFDRQARVVGFPPLDDATGATRPWIVAAVFAGLALASGVRVGRTQIDGATVVREIAEALRAALGPGGEEAIARGAELARRAFESRVEVPRATVERDEESVRLGRRDARASVLPR
jgi:pyruvate-ferredoxin/flavodoxin oxidoreductase